MVSRTARCWLLALVVVAVITIVGGVYLRLSAVPVRILDEAWDRNQFQLSRSFDAKTRAELKWTILRAQVDQFVAPAPPARRVIQFADALRDGEDTVFLRFYGETHIVVVYCWSRRDRKLLWKAIEYHSF